MIGTQELILIFAILLFVFGPSKLPKVAKEVGRAFQEFRKASAGVVDTVNSSIMDEDEENTIISIAKHLNISTEGKSIAQIIEAIKEKG